MPPPSNTSPATAIEITSLPFDTTQNVHDAGTTYTVWYKYTAVAGDTMIGVWGFGGTVGSGYRPALFFSNPDDSTTFAFSCGRNKPGQGWVIAGSTYYFKFETSNPTISPAVLTISVLRFTELSVPVGSILVNDDNTGFPGAVLSSTDASPLKYVQPMAAGELGSILNSGTFMLNEADSSTAKIYNPDFSLVAEISSDTVLGITSNKVDMFYILTDNATTGQLFKVSSTGSIIGGAIANITPAIGAVGNLEYPAVSPDESILYYREFGGVDVDKIKRHNLLTDTPMSNLNDGIAGFSQENREILCLTDGTILSCYRGAGSYIVRRFNPDGSTASTYTSPGGAVGPGTMRLAHAIDDPNSFWFWIEPTEVPGSSRFMNIKVSDGSLLTNIVGIQYEVGEYFGDETVTPLARFGHSQSCPFLILRVVIENGNGNGNGDIDPPMTQEASGIYFINPTKSTKHDSYYNSQERKIPVPKIRTALLGE